PLGFSGDELTLRGGDAYTAAHLDLTGVSIIEDVVGTDGEAAVGDDHMPAGLEQLATVSGGDDVSVKLHSTGTRGSGAQCEPQTYYDRYCERPGRGHPYFPLPLQGGEGNKDYPTARSSVFINLCSLQFATVVDVHRLPFRKDIEHLQSSFTVAVAGVLCAAER